MAPNFPDLQGKRVFVTGGSAGIGKGAALAFAQNGAVVTVLGRRQERLDAVVKEMGGGHSVVADLCSTDQTTAAVREAIKKMGGLDIVVNNGGAVTEGMHKNDLNANVEAFNLHIQSAAATFEAAKEELLKNKGNVVNISSVGATVPMPVFKPYGVAKAGQDYLTRALALEYAPKGVRVNGIQPGAISTEITEDMAKRRGISLEEQTKQMGPMHALGRSGVPHEVAYPILFLASNEAASFVTGVILPVDGGALLKYAANSRKWE